ASGQRPRRKSESEAFARRKFPKTASRPARRAASIPAAPAPTASPPRPRACAPRRGDADCLAPAAEKMEDRGEVGVDAEQLVEVAAGLGHRQGLAEQHHRLLRIATPAEGT